MPTYEYVCTSCNHEFEEFQGMSDEPLKECPKCKGEVRRKISGGLFCIKGRELEKLMDSGRPLDHYAGVTGREWLHKDCS